MRKLLPFLIAAALAAAACSKSPDAAKPADPLGVAVRDAQAELARLHAQGGEKTAREITSLEYPAYRALMKFSGLDPALGGEAQADAALRELFAGYERKARSLEAELPKMIQMAYSGIDIGYSGVATSMIVGMLQGGAAVEVWQQMQQDSKADGVFSQPASDGSKLAMQWSGSHASSTTQFEGKLPGGLQGKVVTKVELDTCPDASGKINVAFTSDSQLRSTADAGVGGSVKVSAKLAMYLDDDAQLIDDRMDSEVHVEQSAFGNGNGSFVDLTQTLSTTRSEMGTKVNRRSQAATDADVQAAQSVAKLGMLAALAAVESAKKAWESGACINLKVTSDPGKRKGIKPNTAFDLEAIPRAKADGAPAGGTVSATLSGGASLQPASGKQRADAKYQYAGPDKKDEQASIAFESRSKRGVGKAELVFDTKEGKAYRITGIGQCTESHDVCDVSKPFTFSMCGGTMSHNPSSATGGSHSFQHSGAHGSGSYTLEGPEEEMIGTYQNTTCALGKCYKTPNGRARWTRIEACE